MPIPKCNGKISYDKKGAITAKNRRWAESHVALRVYQCMGTHWHLTYLDPDRGGDKFRK